VWVASNRLRPTWAVTSVSPTDGQTRMLDGPFAETKEQLGGYYPIDVPTSTLRYPGQSGAPGLRYGTVEVRVGVGDVRGAAVSHLTSEPLRHAAVFG